MAATLGGRKFGVTKGTADVVNTRRVGSCTSGLATFGDRLDDFRCQMAEPQNPADMSLIELETSWEMLCRLRGWRCLIRTRRMAELTPFLLRIWYRSEVRRRNAVFCCCLVR